MLCPLPRCMVGIRAMHWPNDPMKPKVTATHRRPWEKKLTQQESNQIDEDDQNENIAVVQESKAL